jgi:hypothetical protein
VYFLGKFIRLNCDIAGKTHTMFGTVDEPGLIPKCLQRIFLNVGQNIDNKLLFKPVGLENLMPTIDSNLNMEIVVRNYIFKDEKVRVIVFSKTKFDLHLFEQRRIRLPEIVQQQDHFEGLSAEGKTKFTSMIILF